MDVLEFFEAIALFNGIFLLVIRLSNIDVGWVNYMLIIWAFGIGVFGAIGIWITRKYHNYLAKDDEYNSRWGQ